MAFGIKDIILALAFQPSIMKHFIRDMEKLYGARIKCCYEDEQLGTFGAVKNCEETLKGWNEENAVEEPLKFFVLNSDVICRFPLQEMVEKFEKGDVMGVLALTKVQSPSSYGVVSKNMDGLVTDFVEKPDTFIGAIINAGIYLFDTAVFDFAEVRTFKTYLSYV